MALQHQAAMMQAAATAAAVGADPFGAYASTSPPGMGHIGQMQAQLNAAMEGVPLLGPSPRRDSLVT